MTQGSLRLARGEHVAKFLDQLAPDFTLPTGFINNGLGSLDITSDQPLSVLALRLTTNQRGELLITSTPIADLTKTATKDVLAFPQIADGGGYQTQIILLSTSGAASAITVSYLGNDGLPIAVGQRFSGATAGSSSPR